MTPPFVRAIAALLAAAALAILLAPAGADAQRSHWSRHARQRRLDARRESAGDRYESQVERERYCEEVGWDVCEASEQRAAAEFSELFVYPALRWVAGGGIAIFAFLGWSTWRRKRRVIRELYPHLAAAKPTTPPGSLDVVAIDIALDATGADAVRRSVARARARRPDAVALGDVARALTLARAAWTHVAVRSWPLAAAEAAGERYRTIVSEVQARGRSPREPDAPSGYRGGPAAEGALTQVALVSITVLSRDELAEHGGAPMDAATGMLEMLAALGPERIERVDLTWLPADVGETLSAGELLARHPRLIAIPRL